MLQISGHQGQPVHSGGCDQPGVIDVLVALGEKFAPKLRNFARDRQDPVAESNESPADALFDPAGNVALPGSEFDDALVDFADRERTYRKVGGINRIQPCGYVRIRRGLADLAEYVGIEEKTSSLLVILHRPEPRPAPQGRRP